MNREELEVIAQVAAKHIKTEKDLASFRQMLAKTTIEAALNAELGNHLGYAKHQVSEGANSRNGYSDKTLKTEDGSINIAVPRDRDSEFEPQLVKKRQ